MSGRVEALRARWAPATGGLPPLTAGVRVALGAIVVAAAGLRIAWCIYAARPPGPTLNDPVFYRLFGEQLANGNGYRLLDGQASAYYPPGYALALGALFWLADLTPVTDDMHTALVAGLNVGCQLVAVLATFAVARRLVPGRRGAIAGLLAAALVALWPNLIFHTSVTLSESLFLALLLGTMFVAVSGPWGGGRVPPARLVTVGLLLGAATLVRPVSVPVLGALVLGWLVAGAGWRRALGRVAVVTGCTVAVLAPWVVRNAVVMDAVVLSTNTGDNLCMSRRVGGSGGFEFPNERCNRGPFDTLPRPALEVQRDAHGRRLALAFVVDHPAEEARLWFRRARVTFDADADGLSAAEAYGGNPFIPDRLRQALSTTANGYYAVVGSAALVGVVNLARRPSGPRVFVVASFVGLLAPPLVFFGDDRFKIPAVPLAAVAVGVLVGDLLAARTDGGVGGSPARRRSDDEAPPTSIPAPSALP